MSRLNVEHVQNEEISLQDEKLMENELTQIIPVFFKDKSQMDTLKKRVDEMNKAIKSTMNKLGFESFKVGDLIATQTVRKTQEIMEELAINKLKELKLQKGIVKKKEYIDMDALENAIYTGKVDALILSDCKIEKESYVLKVSKLKAKKGEK